MDLVAHAEVGKVCIQFARLVLAPSPVEEFAQVSETELLPQLLTETYLTHQLLPKGFKFVNFFLFALTIGLH